MKELKCPHCGNVFAVDENDYVALLNQVKNDEFETELARRIHELEQSQQERLQAEKQAELARQQADAARQQNERMRLEQANQQALQAKDNQLRDKDAEIALLRQKIDNFEVTKKAAVQEAVMLKDRMIQQLESDQKLAASEALNEVNRIKEDYEHKLKEAETEVELYKNLKARMSTKMVGETLEQHCAAEFETIRPYLPNAYFEKDNEVVDKTKGDFIFRMYSEDGIETVSIMFEMKNETDDAVSKKKRNADHFDKLDEDRKKKNCEYAVLVSLLEPDNELYNRGIVDVSYKHPKMYVIRPQFFVPLITLLVNEAKKSLEYKQQLAVAKSQNIDVTNFEDKLKGVVGKIFMNYENASSNYDAAIKAIDASIAKMEEVKKALSVSEKWLKAAVGHTDDLSIRKLTNGNQTMQAKFDEARQKKLNESNPQKDE